MHPLSQLAAVHVDGDVTAEPTQTAEDGYQIPCQQLHAVSSDDQHSHEGIFQVSFS